MTTLFDATPSIDTLTDKPRDCTAHELSVYLVWVALRHGVYVPADAKYTAQGIFSGGVLILEMPGYGQSQTVTCEILDDAGNVVRSMPLPVDKRGKLPMTVAQAKDWTSLQNVRKPRKAAAKPERVAAAPEPIEVAPEPVAAPVEAPTPVVEIAAAPEPVTVAQYGSAAADVEAAAAIEAAGLASPTDNEAAPIWRQYVATAYGVGPDGWTLSVGPQRDRKARNRGLVVLDADAQAVLASHFAALFPQHAPALPSEAAAVPAVEAPSPDADLVATVAALAARVAALETGAAPQTRAARTPAHLRAIRAYLKLRIERAALRAAAAAVSAKRGDTAARLRKARGLIRWQDRNRAVMLESLAAAEDETIRLREFTGTLEQSRATLQVRCDDQAAELSRLAPVISALAALNRPALAIAA